MHHFVTEMCIRVHISVTKWCIVEYVTGAFWVLCNKSIDQFIPEYSDIITTKGRNRTSMGAQEDGNWFTWLNKPLFFVMPSFKTFKWYPAKSFGVDIRKGCVTPFQLPGRACWFPVAHSKFYRMWSMKRWLPCGGGQDDRGFIFTIYVLNVFEKHKNIVAWYVTISILRWHRSLKKLSLERQRPTYLTK